MNSFRPVLMGRQCAVAAGHYLAAEAGFEILKAGGNAVDAGVATGLATGVLQSDIVNVAGVAPMLIWLADRQEIVSIDGLGTWPRNVRPDLFMRDHRGVIPEGLLRTVVPAAPAAWLTALERYGTMSFGDVAQAALTFARDGFPMHPLMAQTIAESEEQYRRWPSSAAIYLPRGYPPRVGEIFVQADLARTLQYMIDAETANRQDGREAGIRAAYDAFYRGDIGQAISDFHSANGGLLTMKDLADYRVSFEPTVKAALGDVTVHCCGPWSQGPTLAQVIALLNPYDLGALGHNSPEYIHLVAEALKLAFADREAFIGDPKFITVPIQEMLSDSYLRERRSLIQGDRAHPEMPPAGNPKSMQGTAGATSDFNRQLQGNPPSFDTSYICVVDGQGNAFSATPSDVSRDTPVIPGTGLCPSSRGSQSRPDPRHPASVAPGKRPRLTPNPALAMKDNKPFLVFGSPGADVQIQAMLQVFLNVSVFGMDVQAAVEAPRFATYSFPASFAPYDYFPGRLNLESRLPVETAETLSSLGHQVEWWPDLVWRAGGVCAILVDHETGVRHAGADPRRPSYALAW